MTKRKNIPLTINVPVAKLTELVEQFIAREIEDNYSDEAVTAAVGEYGKTRAAFINKVLAANESMLLKDLKAYIEDECIGDMFDNDYLLESFNPPKEIVAATAVADKFDDDAYAKEQDAKESAALAGLLDGDVIKELMAVLKKKGLKIAKV